MAGMADHPIAPEPAAGPPLPAAQARPENSAAAKGSAEIEGRTAAWRTSLAVLALSAVVGGLVAGVLSAAQEPSPPDLGGPILAKGPVPTVSPAPARPAPDATPTVLTPPVLTREGLASNARASAAAEVPIRPVPLPVSVTDPGSRQFPAAPDLEPRTAAPAPASASATP
jgi:hypothetical protein